jgi:hypothetical protein
VEWEHPNTKDVLRPFVRFKVLLRMSDDTALKKLPPILSTSFNSMLLVSMLYGLIKFKVIVF